MNLGQSHTQAATIQPAPSQTETRLQGGWLVSARVAWVVVLILTVGLFISRIPYTFGEARIICASAACSGGSYLTPDLARELRHLGLSMDFYATIFLIWSIALELVYVATGAVIFWRRSDDRMALISSLTLVTFGTGFSGFNPQPPLAPLFIVLWLGLAFFNSCCGGLFFYTFPTGRFVPRWSGLLALVWIVYWGIHDLILATILTNSGLDFVIFAGLLVSIVVTQVYRYRRVSTPLERQQTKWVVFGISLALLGVLTLFTLWNIVSIDIIPDLILGSFLYVFLLLIPLSIGIAILRSHLWDIDIIINRTLVYGTLTACVVALYVLVVVGLGALLQSRGNLLVSLLATGLVAVLFQPLRARLQLAVNRLMYGERDTPNRVISRLGQRLEATLAPDDVLPTIVETVAQALKLPYAAITLKQQGEIVTAASYGAPQAGLTRLPLVYHSEPLGELVLAPRGPGESFTPADRALLEDLARQAGIAAHAVRLTSDLQRLAADVQRSREQLVTAREEERRRLRRDLHDGLGPSLATITVKAEAARDGIAAEPAQAMLLLEELIGQAQTAISDIRRLVYNLRPPALDDLGLVAAIRAQALHYDHPGLHISIEAPQQLPELSAAVEVAAYRIAQEALTNVVRHAQARSCHIRLTWEAGALLLEITDDGCGIAASRQAGVGLRSMRERAEEVGGTCVVEALPDKGTRVRASLPVSVEVGQRAQEPV